MKISKNILKVVLVVLLAIGFSSCNDDKGDSITYPEIKVEGLNGDLSLILNQSESFMLSGGDGKFEVSSNAPQVAGVKVDGKSFTITGLSAGMAVITVKSASQEKTINVEIMETPSAGVYMGAEKKAELNHSVKNSNGLWLLGKAGNPYDGKRLYVSKLEDNLQKGQTVNLTLRAFNIDGLENSSSAMVEVVTPEIVKLKVGEYSVVIPNE